MKKIVYLLLLAFVFTNCIKKNDCLDCVVYKNGNILTLKDEKILENHTIIVENDIIIEILPTNDFYKNYVVPDTSIYDLKNKFVMPSLQEMHAHIEPLNPNHKKYLKHFLAYGVTQVRVMAGNERLLSFRDSIDDGYYVSPNLKLSSPLIDGNPPLWGEAHDGPIVDATSNIDSIFKAQLVKGYDFIKTYDRVPKEQYLAFLEIADDRSIKLAAHVPMEFNKENDIKNLLSSNLQSFEHFINFGSFVTSDSIKKVDYPNDTKYYNHEVIKNIDKEKVSQVVSRIKNKNVWICPTSVLWKNNSDTLYIDKLTQTKEFKRLDDGLKSWWRSTRNSIENYSSSNTLNNILLSEMAKQNVKILAGTDFPNPFLIPGYSLHQEIHNIANAGYGNLSALKSATVFPAEYWGDEQSSGFLEVGVKANFIVLDKNPLSDISNTLSITNILYNGVILNHEQLLNEE